MSFSSDVKKEACSCDSLNRDELRAELYGMLLFGREFSESKIVFTTESKHSCNRFVFLLENLYRPIIERRSALRTRNGTNRLYKVSVMDGEDCRRIYEDFGHSPSQIMLRINRANLSGDELVPAFVRGVFLGCGSVCDPQKSYHLEFCVPHKNLSLDLCKVFTEIPQCALTPKTVVRSGSYVVYFKESEQICDLLTYMGAPMQAMEVMGAKAVKQVRNNINRRINGEVANINKVADASARQIEAIERIKSTVGLGALPDDLREIAVLRLENPEMSLRALGQSLSVPISRSGANHRMMRILEIAGENQSKADNRK